MYLFISSAVPSLPCLPQALLPRNNTRVTSFYAFQFHNSLCEARAHLWRAGINRDNSSVPWGESRGWLGCGNKHGRRCMSWWELLLCAFVPPQFELVSKREGKFVVSFFFHDFSTVLKFWSGKEENGVLFVTYHDFVRLWYYKSVQKGMEVCSIICFRNHSNAFNFWWGKTLSGAFLPLL